MAGRYRKSYMILFILLFSLSIITSCMGPNLDDPRQVVISMFGAMEKNDPAALAHLLDLTELMKDSGEDYALNTNQARVFTNPQHILDDLTNEGITKRRWFSLQRIVNESKVLSEENAEVDVTFVDKNSSKGYMTTFGLKRLNGEWRIYSFQTKTEAP